MSSGKAAEAGGIPLEVYQCGSNIVAIRLTQLLIVIGNADTVPQGYKDAMIVHL